MGYTVSMKPPKSKRLKMLQFMAKEFRPWSQLTGRADGLDYVSDLKTEPDELDYCPRKGYMGFNYNASLFEREYAFSVIRWMALQVGQKAYFYDEERTPINPQEFENGVPIPEQMAHPMERRHWDSMCAEFPDHFKILKAEMARLEQAWVLLEE